MAVGRARPRQPAGGLGATCRGCCGWRRALVRRGALHRRGVARARWRLPAAARPRADLLLHLARDRVLLSLFELARGVVARPRRRAAPRRRASGSWRWRSGSGFALAGFLNLPLQEYARYSIRGGGAGGGVGLDYATGWSFSPVELPTFLVPGAVGLRRPTYWGAMPFTDYPNYMGLARPRAGVPRRRGAASAVHVGFLLVLAGLRAARLLRPALPALRLPALRPPAAVQQVPRAGHDPHPLPAVRRAAGRPRPDARSRRRWATSARGARLIALGAGAIAGAGAAVGERPGARRLARRRYGARPRTRRGRRDGARRDRAAAARTVGDSCASACSRWSRWARCWRAARRVPARGRRGDRRRWSRWSTCGW